MTQQKISNLAAHIKNYIGKGLLAATLALSGCGVQQPQVNDCVYINRVQYDAHGRDNQNLNDEFVVLENGCNREIDITGWSVRDEDGNQYTFPSRTMDIERIVCLRSGAGFDSSHNAYWRSNGRPIWNNDKDTAYLFNELGTLVQKYAYDNRERR